MGRRTIAVAKDAGERPAWEAARATPAPQLHGIVGGYCGYVEDAPAAVRRREAATSSVTLILSFGDPLDVQMSIDRNRTSMRSFVAGPGETWAITEHAGRQAGVQVDLTPLGAYRLFGGAPVAEVADQVVDVGDAWGRPGAELCDRLASASDWAERFALLDAVLAARLDGGPVPDRPVAWACRQLVGSFGQAGVAELADEIGWSRRHLTNRFRQQVGVAPKPFGRVVRFRRAMAMLEGTVSVVPRPAQGPATTIADVAAAAGYADHSHLVRECRALAGCTPSELLAPVPAASHPSKTGDDPRP
jgi:AraC-like DNA-binding protein